ncbi:hypothetical protein Tco_0146419 [Tanacetum coccineum]
MFRYGDTNADAIKLKLFPSSLAGEDKIWFNELSPDVITTWEEIRQGSIADSYHPAIFDRNHGRNLSNTTRIDSQFKEIRGDMKEMRDGCNKYGGPHPSSDCDDRPMGGPKEEEANYASEKSRRFIMVNNSRNWLINMKIETKPSEEEPTQFHVTQRRNHDESDSRNHEIHNHSLTSL